MGDEIATSKPAAEVNAALEAWGHRGETRVFPEGVPTSAVAAERLGCEVGAIANSLVFLADAEPILVLASGRHRVKTKRLRRSLGVTDLTLAPADVVLRTTGQAVGGVAPVSHPTKLRTLVDAALRDYPVIWAGGGDELTMFSTDFDQLTAITEAEVFDNG